MTRSGTTGSLLGDLRVILIDGRRLADLMIEHNVGVRVSRTVESERLDEDVVAGED